MTRNARSVPGRTTANMQQYYAFRISLSTAARNSNGSHLLGFQLLQCLSCSLNLSCAYWKPVVDLIIQKFGDYARIDDGDESDPGIAAPLSSPLASASCPMTPGASRQPWNIVLGVSEGGAFRGFTLNAHPSVTELEEPTAADH
jgi:hypothetical protein